jgi:HNH endonuclease
MDVEWSGDRCVLCLDQAPLTSEHIIPSSLGGILTCSFLCRACNSDLGAYLEALAKTDPSIRLASGHLQTQIPELAKKLTEGQDFISHGPGGKSQGTVKNGQFQTRARTEADGSLTQPTKHARHSIAKMLRKSGVGETPIEEALQRFEEAPENERISVGHGIEAIKWTIERIEPDLSKSVLLSPLVPLKIAYEFLACHLGTAIYDEARQMAELRMVLRERIETHPCYSVERLTASEYKPFHGIVFEGNDPYAKVLIRLFGWLAFRVHLRHLAVGGHQFIYTHLLDSNKEDIRIVNPEYVTP